eukprot:366769-Prymnesium_polylepis.2
MGHATVTAILSSGQFTPWCRHDCLLSSASARGGADCSHGRLPVSPAHRAHSTRRAGGRYAEPPFSSTKSRHQTANVQRGGLERGAGEQLPCGSRSACEGGADGERRGSGR